ncbi:hypothetical protein ACFS4T_07010 [Pseudomonas lini]
MLLTGIDELSPKLGALRAKVESFKKKTWSRPASANWTSAVCSRAVA